MTDPVPQAQAAAADTSPVLAVRSLTKTFGQAASADMLAPGCHDVSFDLMPGETIGIVGESGSGKTTLGKCIAGLLPSDVGVIKFDGRDVATMSSEERRDFRRRVQIVFQNPDNALNPRMTVGRFVAEALKNYNLASKGERRGRLLELASLVGLRDDHIDRYPHQLSGGQKQRVSIMRALACEPNVIVLDEPTSALDVSVQAQVLRTLREIQERRSVSFVLISHDVGVVRYMCRHLMVMYLGRVVETGSAEAVVAKPAHPYTRALVDAVPRLRRTHERDFRLLSDTATRRTAASACQLRLRCPLATDACATTPPMRQVDDRHDAACWSAEASRLGNVQP
jgi:oligopeptide/dipeptide ABC transporter ATP-binding protein